MRLGIAVQDGGIQPAAWRLPDANSGVPAIDHFVRMAQTAENACLDFVFKADGVGLRNKEAMRKHQLGGDLEPLTMFAALAMVTSKIGLVGTISTTFTQPFYVARQLASLDHISGGRMGWNIVTSYFGQENFGDPDDLPNHDVRYAMAEEHVQATTQLWDSWEDDAKIFDQEAGIFADPDKIHEINFVGDYYRVQGPLNVSRPPQGRPVLVQAGSSDWGTNFGARWAEVIFTSQTEIPKAQAFYALMKQKIAQAGRDPNAVAIMPGISPYVAATEQEAVDKWMSYVNMLDPRDLVSAVERELYVDLSEFDLDDTIPDSYLKPADEFEGHQSRYRIYRNWAVNDKRTIRQLAAEATSSAGHWLTVGSGEQVANQMIERFENGAADGFNILPGVTPGTLNDFVEFVLPILQDRGYFRTEYTGDTLRDHLGLQRPVSQFAAE